MNDVIVVGGGPAGNIAALRLSEMGHDVAVLDWRHNLGDKLCTGIIGRECFERFRPDPKSVLHEARSVRVFSPSGASYTAQKENPEAYVIDRVAFVASLARRAAGAGATYSLGQKVVEIRINEDGVKVETVGRGEIKSHSARALVVASGFGTPLLNLVGLSTGLSQGHMIACQAKVAVDGLEETEVYLGSAVAPGSFGWLVPLSHSKALAGIVSQQTLNGHMGNFLSRLTQAGKIDAVVDEPRRWGIPIEPLPQTYNHRVLVAGDAAGLVKPTTGGGIYYSLLSGEIAAQVLSGAIRADDLSAHRLREYQSTWKSLFGRELAIGLAARQLYESLDDSQVGKVLDRLASINLNCDLVSSREFAFDWHSKVIATALGQRQLSMLVKSFGPIVAPLLVRLSAIAR